MDFDNLFSQYNISLLAILPASNALNESKLVYVQSALIIPIQYEEKMIDGGTQHIGRQKQTGRMAQKFLKIPTSFRRGKPFANDLHRLPLECSRSGYTLNWSRHRH
jgi:hypothetical protein